MVSGQSIDRLVKGKELCRLERKDFFIGISFFMHVFYLNLVILCCSFSEGF